MKRWWVLVLLGGALFTWNLWGYDLWAPDEPYFAEGAREMIADGRWLVPHVNGVVTTDKPPLFFWLIALFSWPGGSVTSLTARLPSVLAAIGSLLLTVRLGRRMLGNDAGLLAGLLLMGNYLFWDKARSAQTDAVLAFLILLALSAFEAFRSGSADGRRAGVVFWIASALAVLTKGPVGVMLPVGIVLITLAGDRRIRRLGQFAPLLGPACFLGVVMAWAIPASLWDPAQYTVLGALEEHFVDRAVHGMHHAQPFWYYLRVLPVQLMPWSALLPGALLFAWRRRSANDRFLMTIFLFVVLFFSVSTEKRDLYVLPCYPAAALMVAGLVHALRPGTGEASARRGSISRRWATVPLLLTGLLLICIGIVMFAFAARVEQVSPPIIRSAGVLILLAGVPATIAAARRRIEASLTVIITGVGVFYLFGATLILPALDSVKSAREFAQVVKEETAVARAAGAEVLAYRLFNLPEALALYSDGVYLVETNDSEVLADHLTQSSRSYAVVDANRLGRLPDDVAARIVTVATTRRSRIDVALVHNGAGAR